MRWYARASLGLFLLVLSACVRTGQAPVPTLNSPVVTPSLAISVTLPSTAVTSPLLPGWALYHSPGLEYTIAYPQAWRVREGGAPAGAALRAVFQSPETNSEVVVDVWDIGAQPGFDLRGWVSTNEHVLRDCPAEPIAYNATILGQPAIFCYEPAEWGTGDMAALFFASQERIFRVVVFFSAAVPRAEAESSIYRSMLESLSLPGVAAGRFSIPTDWEKGAGLITLVNPPRPAIADLPSEEQQLYRRGLTGKVENWNDTPHEIHFTLLADDGCRHVIYGEPFRVHFNGSPIDYSYDVSVPPPRDGDRVRVAGRLLDSGEVLAQYIGVETGGVWRTWFYKTLFDIARDEFDPVLLSNYSNGEETILWLQGPLKRILPFLVDEVDSPIRPERWSQYLEQNALARCVPRTNGDLRLVLLDLYAQEGECTVSKSREYCHSWQQLYPPDREESADELKQALAPTATPTPSLVPITLPDLTPPSGGWIAFRTPEGHLALVSPDTSRSIFVTEQGEVTDFAWSPDGRRLAFIANLGGSTGGQLALVSLGSSRLTPLTRPGTVDPGLAWSQDSRSLALLYRMNPEKDRSPLALRLFDISTQQVVTLTTYSNSLSKGDIPALCPQAFPRQLLPVYLVGGPSWGSVEVRDSRVGAKVVELGPVSYCKHLWLPGGEGLIFPKVELAKEGVRQRGVEEEVVHPVGLALWRVGDEVPVVVLEGTKQRSYSPVRWLPDGRLMVRVMQWEKAEYEGPAQPERVEYRFFYVNEAGEFLEAEGGDLPWWAAGRFDGRLVATRLFRTTGGSLVGDWMVGPDGETVVFTWRWEEGGGFKSAIYLWQGQGEPQYLTAGEYPRWQPQSPAAATAAPAETAMLRTPVPPAVPGLQGNGHSYNPGISADGRWVAFQSEASNLVKGDTNGMSDVFVHDRQTGTTERVSVASDGTQGDGESFSPTISADGRWVAFWSFASNLAAGDTNECPYSSGSPNCPDVFVRDLQTGTTERVSVASDGTQANEVSGASGVSADGRWVVFWSLASNLVVSDDNGFMDVFVHDRLTGRTERVP